MITTVKEEFWDIETVEKPITVGFTEENGTTTLLLDGKPICTIDTDCLEEFLVETGRVICHWKERKEDDKNVE